MIHFRHIHMVARYQKNAFSIRSEPHGVRSVLSLLPFELSNLGDRLKLIVPIQILNSVKSRRLAEFLVGVVVHHHVK